MKQILVVDDRETNLDAVKSALGEVYKVTAAASGQQALNFLENNACDLLLIDCEMPGQDGFQTLAKIRETGKNRRLPVVFLTEGGDPETEKRCLEAGAADFIAKPFACETLKIRIGRILKLEDWNLQMQVDPEQENWEVGDGRGGAGQDALTGLWNRAYARESVDNLISEGTRGALFLIDVDNFQAINANYGHVEGDNTLKMFANTMREFASEKDVICRIGGDEFLMFLSGLTDQKKIAELAEEISSEFASQMEEKWYETNTSVSIGIAQIPEDGEDFAAACAAADKALYYVKQTGKNGYHFYSERKEEAALGGTLVDLKYLREIMSRSDPGRGAYQLDLDSFRHVYNFVRRFVERSGQNVQTVLFTAASETVTDQGEIEEALEKLEQAIYTSLRRTDVSTRYSSKQVIVILMDASTENGEQAAKRIMEGFEKIYTDGRVRITYDIAKMEKSIQNKSAR